MPGSMTGGPQATTYEPVWQEKGDGYQNILVEEPKQEGLPQHSEAFLDEQVNATL